MPEIGVAQGLYYEAYDGPDANAPAVILSAGLGGSGAFWAPQMQALAAHFRVVVYDHRGTARSTRTLTTPHCVEAMADDILAIMDALGLGRAHIVGHAAGGLAGLSLALRHANRLDRLALINAWSRPDPHIARCFQARLSLLNDSGRAAYVNAQPIFLYPANWSSQNAPRLAEEAERQIANFPAKEAMRARIDALLAFDIDRFLPEIKAPVLVSAAADDMLVPALCSERLAARLPNAQLAIAPWGGHGFTVTAPEAFNPTLVGFLRGETGST